MSKVTEEIIEYLRKRYDINISTTNYLINRIEGAIKASYVQGGNDSIAKHQDDTRYCGDPGCPWCR